MQEYRELKIPVSPIKFLTKKKKKADNPNLVKTLEKFQNYTSTAPQAKTYLNSNDVFLN